SVTEWKVTEYVKDIAYLGNALSGGTLKVTTKSVDGSKDEKIETLVYSGGQLTEVLQMNVDLDGAQGPGTARGDVKTSYAYSGDGATAQVTITQEQIFNSGVSGKAVASENESYKFMSSQVIKLGANGHLDAQGETPDDEVVSVDWMQNLPQGGAGAAGGTGAATTALTRIRQTEKKNPDGSTDMQVYEVAADGTEPLEKDRRYFSWSHEVTVTTGNSAATQMTVTTTEYLLDANGHRVLGKDSSVTVSFYDGTATAAHLNRVEKTQNDKNGNFTAFSKTTYKILNGKRVSDITQTWTEADAEKRTASNFISQTFYVYNQKLEFKDGADGKTQVVLTSQTAAEDIANLDYEVTVGTDSVEIITYAQDSNGNDQKKERRLWSIPKSENIKPVDPGKVINLTTHQLLPDFATKLSAIAPAESGFGVAGSNWLTTSFSNLEGLPKDFDAMQPAIQQKVINDLIASGACSQVGDKTLCGDGDPSTVDKIVRTLKINDTLEISQTEFYATTGGQRKLIGMIVIDPTTETEEHRLALLNSVSDELILDASGNVVANGVSFMYTPTKDAAGKKVLGEARKSISWIDTGNAGLQSNIHQIITSQGVSSDQVISYRADGTLESLLLSGDDPDGTGQLNWRITVNPDKTVSLVDLSLEALTFRDPRNGYVFQGRTATSKNLFNPQNAGDSVIFNQSVSSTGSTILMSFKTDGNCGATGGKDVCGLLQGGNPILSTFGTSWQVLINKNGQLEFTLNGDKTITVTGTKNFSNDQNHQLAVIFDPVTGLKISVDGNLELQSSEVKLNQSDTQVMIGTTTVPGADWLKIPNVPQIRDFKEYTTRCVTSGTCGAFFVVDGKVWSYELWKTYGFKGEIGGVQIISEAMDQNKINEHLHPSAVQNLGRKDRVGTLAIKDPSTGVNRQIKILFASDDKTVSDYQTVLNVFVDDGKTPAAGKEPAFKNVFTAAVEIPRVNAVYGTDSFGRKTLTQGKIYGSSYETGPLSADNLITIFRNPGAGKTPGDVISKLQYQALNLSVFNDKGVLFQRAHVGPETFQLVALARKPDGSTVDGPLNFQNVGGNVVPINGILIDQDSAGEWRIFDANYAYALTQPNTLEALQKNVTTALAALGVLQTNLANIDSNAPLATINFDQASDPGFIGGGRLLKGNPSSPFAAQGINVPSINFTFSIKILSNTKDGGLFQLTGGSGTKYNFLIRDDVFILVEDDGEGTQRKVGAMSPLQQGQWSVLTMSVEAGVGFKVYMNGQIVGEGSEDGFLSAQNLMLGWAKEAAILVRNGPQSHMPYIVPGDDYYFTGAMDEIQIFNGVRGSAEVLSDYLIDLARKNNPSAVPDLIRARQTLATVPFFELSGNDGVAFFNPRMISNKSAFVTTGGILGGAFSFDAAHSKMEVKKGFSSINSTISLGFNAIKGDGTIFESANGDTQLYLEKNTLWFQNEGVKTKVSDGIQSSTNRWYSVAFTIGQDGGWKIFLDGTEKTTGKLSNLTLQDLSLGNGTAKQFEGWMDEILIFSTALSALEIKARYDLVGAQAAVQNTQNKLDTAPMGIAPAPLPSPPGGEGKGAGIGAISGVLRPTVTVFQKGKPVVNNKVETLDKDGHKIKVDHPNAVAGTGLIALAGGKTVNVINPYTGTQYFSNGNPFEIRSFGTGNNPLAVNISDPTKPAITTLGQYDPRFSKENPVGTQIKTFASPTDLITFDDKGNFKSGTLLFRIQTPPYLFNSQDPFSGRAPPEQSAWITFRDGGITSYRDPITRDVFLPFKLAPEFLDQFVDAGVDAHGFTVYRAKNGDILGSSAPLIAAAHPSDQIQTSIAGIGSRPISTPVSITTPACPNDNCKGYARFWADTDGSGANLTPVWLPDYNQGLDDGGNLPYLAFKDANGQVRLLFDDHGLNEANINALFSEKKILPVNSSDTLPALANQPNLQFIRHPDFGEMILNGTKIIGFPPLPRVSFRIEQVGYNPPSFRSLPVGIATDSFNHFITAETTSLTRSGQPVPDKNNIFVNGQLIQGGVTFTSYNSERIRTWEPIPTKITTSTPGASKTTVFYHQGEMDPWKGRFTIRGLENVPNLRGEYNDGNLRALVFLNLNPASSSSNTVNTIDPRVLQNDAEFQAYFPATGFKLYLDGKSLTEFILNEAKNFELRQSGQAPWHTYFDTAMTDLTFRDAGGKIYTDYAVGRVIDSYKIGIMLSTGTHAYAAAPVTVKVGYDASLRVTSYRIADLLSGQTAPVNISYDTLGNVSSVSAQLDSRRLPIYVGDTSQGLLYGKNLADTFSGKVKTFTLFSSTQPNPDVFVFDYEDIAAQKDDLKGFTINSKSITFENRLLKGVTYWQNRISQLTYVDPVTNQTKTLEFNYKTWACGYKNRSSCTDASLTAVKLTGMGSDWIYVGAAQAGSSNKDSYGRLATGQGLVASYQVERDSFGAPTKIFVLAYEKGDLGKTNQSALTPKQISTNNQINATSAADLSRLTNPSLLLSYLQAPGILVPGSSQNVQAAFNLSFEDFARSNSINASIYLQTLNNGQSTYKLTADKATGTDGLHIIEGSAQGNTSFDEQGNLFGFQQFDRKIAFSGAPAFQPPVILSPASVTLNAVKGLDTLHPIKSVYDVSAQTLRLATFYNAQAQVLGFREFSADSVTPDKLILRTISHIQYDSAGNQRFSFTNEFGIGVFGANFYSTDFRAGFSVKDPVLGLTGQRLAPLELVRTVQNNLSNAAFIHSLDPKILQAKNAGIQNLADQIGLIDSKLTRNFAIFDRFHSATLRISSVERLFRTDENKSLIAGLALSGNPNFESYRRVEILENGNLTRTFSLSVDFVAPTLPKADSSKNYSFSASSANPAFEISSSYAVEKSLTTNSLGQVILAQRTLYDSNGVLQSTFAETRSFNFSGQQIYSYHREGEWNVSSYNTWDRFGQLDAVNEIRQMTSKGRSMSPTVHISVNTNTRYDFAADTLVSAQHITQTQSIKRSTNVGAIIAMVVVLIIVTIITWGAATAAMAAIMLGQAVAFTAGVALASLVLTTLATIFSIAGEITQNKALIKTGAILGMAAAVVGLGAGLANALSSLAKIGIESVKALAQAVWTAAKTAVQYVFKNIVTVFGQAFRTAVLNYQITQAFGEKVAKIFAIAFGALSGFTSIGADLVKYGVGKALAGAANFAQHLLVRIVTNAVTTFSLGLISTMAQATVSFLATGTFDFGSAFKSLAFSTLVSVGITFLQWGLEKSGFTGLFSKRDV
ncbi:MAG: hypothetical protein EXS63_09265, partial [Candidatus Omnitrophica bacterium]|nr:hypothetical protein [Candidatus Omnitrophota bacterium]